MLINLAGCSRGIIKNTNNNEFISSKGPVSFRFEYPVAYKVVLDSYQADYEVDLEYKDMENENFNRLVYVFVGKLPSETATPDSLIDEQISDLKGTSPNFHLNGRTTIKLGGARGTQFDATYMFNFPNTSDTTKVPMVYRKTCFAIISSTVIEVSIVSDESKRKTAARDFETIIDTFKLRSD